MRNTIRLNIQINFDTPLSKHCKKHDHTNVYHIDDASFQIKIKQIEHLKGKGKYIQGITVPHLHDSWKLKT